MIIGFLILTSILVLVDVLMWRSSLIFRKNKIVRYLLFGTTIYLFADLSISVYHYAGTIGIMRSATKSLFPIMLVLLPKIIYLILHSIYWIVLKVKNLGCFIFNKNIEPDTSKRKFFETLALGTSLIPLLPVLRGHFVGRYDYRLKKVQLFFDNLPKSFDGFTIIQISDLHLGSMPQKDPRVIKALQNISKENADLFVCTGDFVNNIHNEIDDEWIKHLKSTTAKGSKIAVLGNHDYGDYADWENDEQKQENLETIKSKIKESGFQLLLNESLKISRGNEFIEILGVENWGKKPFRQSGDIQKALQDTNPDSFKVLLSHDPSHYDLVISKQKEHIDLTLSGHTHGFQMGIKIADKEFSPSQMKYPRWKGLYNMNERYLYVNPGFGTIGMPSRINMPPEITTFELKSV